MKYYEKRSKIRKIWKRNHTAIFPLNIGTLFLSHHATCLLDHSHQYHSIFIINVSNPSKLVPISYPAEKTKYYEMIRCLMYAMVMMHPDIMIAVSFLSQYQELHTLQPLLKFFTISQWWLSVISQRNHMKQLDQWVVSSIFLVSSESCNKLSHLEAWLGVICCIVSRN